MPDIIWKYSGIENAARVRSAMQSYTYEGSLEWIKWLGSQCRVGSYCESGGICVHLWQDETDLSVHAQVTISVYGVAQMLGVWEND